MGNPPRPRVGLVGLGAMGLGMAQSLRRAGHAPHVFDVRRDAAQAFAQEGGIACETLAELGARCDVVVSVVVNAAQTETILFGKGGVAETLPKGAVFVSSATMDPDVARRLAARLVESGGSISMRRSAAAHNVPRKANSPFWRRAAATPSPRRDPRSMPWRQNSMNSATSRGRARPSR